MSETRHNPDPDKYEPNHKTAPGNSETRQSNTNGSNLSTKLLVAGCTLYELVVQNPYSKVFYGIQRVTNLDKKSANRHVAIKLISLEGPRARNRLSIYNQEIEAFHEIDNPHIVPLYNIEVSNRSIVFIMRWINGPTLETSRKQTAWTRAMGEVLFNQLADALSAIHEHDIIHGDVHIGNVMLWKPLDPQQPKNMHVYLLDFGLSRGWSKDPLAPLTPRPLTPRDDIQGLARLMQMVWWPEGDPKPDANRGLTHKIIAVLCKALDENCPYNTIEEFTKAFQNAAKRSLKPITQSRRSVRLATQTAEMVQVTVEVTPPAPDSVTIPTAEVSIVSATDLQPVVAMQTKRPKNLWPWVVIAMVIVVGVILALIGFEAESSILSVPQIGVVFDIRQERVVLMNSGSEQMVYSYQNFPASVVAYSLNGEYLAAERAVINRHTGRLVRMFDDQPMPIALALSADGAIMALHDGTVVRLLDVTNNILLHILPGIHPDEVQTLFTPAGYPRLRTAIAGSRRETALAATR